MQSLIADGRRYAQSGLPSEVVTTCVGDYSEMAALSKGGGRRMSFPKKHIYQKGSPGAAREKAKTTLMQIKREIERDPAMRREYQKRGLLASGRPLVIESHAVQ